MCIAVCHPFGQRKQSKARRCIPQFRFITYAKYLFIAMEHKTPYKFYI